MVNGDALKLHLDATVQDLSQNATDPQEWADWVLYLLEVLDREAQRGGQRAAYDAMLSNIRDELQTRLAHKSWWAGYMQSAGRNSSRLV